MLDSLLTKLKGETGRALIRTFLAKGVSAFGALGLVVIIGQLYGPEGVGVYALAQAVLMGAGILARRGMDSALMRFVGRDHHAPHIRHYLYWAGRRSLWVSLPMSATLFFLREQVEHFFSMPGLAEVLLGIALAIPFYTWSFLLAGFFKGIRKPASASLQENGAIALVAGALLLILDAMRQTEVLELSLLGWVYLAGAVLVALQGHCVMLLREWRHGSRESSSLITLDHAGELRSASLSFFIMGLAGFMQRVLGVLIAGKLLAAADLGLFKSAQQIAMSVVFVLMVINAIFPPKFAALYHQGKMVALGKTARRAALLGLVMSSPFLLACLLVPEWILGLLGDGFEEAATLLRIVALGQLVNVATGSVGYLMNMTGHDKFMRVISLTCNSLGLLGFFVLTHWLGALGTALALAFVLVAQNLAALVAVWIKLGIWTLPGPNWLAMVGIGSQAGAKEG